ncbi:MAG: hypothetical protein JSV86_21180 [Gemmatimonadota bacterium]|nr:MAG: hypothetical protein JSV86_21180 [Gemmatimonadota bacterium]
MPVSRHLSSNTWKSAERAARSLVEQGFLLEEDVDRVVARAADHWDWVHQN